jgi:hypothetical protein
MYWYYNAQNRIGLIGLGDAPSKREAMAPEAREDARSFVKNFRPVTFASDLLPSLIKSTYASTIAPFVNIKR